MNRKTVLVTGAQGFVGRPLCRELVQQGFAVRAAVRKQRTLHDSEFVKVIEVGDLSHFADWSVLSKGSDAIIHLVARTHVTDEFGNSALAKYRRTNVDVTRRLAKAAIRAGSSHFIFMSSIKAVGNGANEAYCESTPCAPEDSYGITKLEAEKELINALRGTDCAYTILRPPLVYGPNVRGNFLKLLKFVRRGVPMPAVSNARSMVHVGNLVDAVICCLRNDAAQNELFHVADEHPISTSELVRTMARGMDCRARLVPLPQTLLRTFGTALGRGEEMKRLVGSLTVSTEKLQNDLGWQAKLSIDEGVLETSRLYAQQPWLEEAKESESRTAVRTKTGKAA